jgi:hypothetical protein
VAAIAFAATSLAASAQDSVTRFRLAGVPGNIQCCIALRRADFFLVDAEISNAAASDSLGNLAPERQRPRIWRSQRAHYGQWSASRGPQTAAFPSGHCP